MRTECGPDLDLETCETINPVRAESERLAPPQVFADYYPFRAHNGSSRKREAQMITAPAPIRAFSAPSPESLAPFIPCFFSQNSFTTHPPPCGNHFLTLLFFVTYNKSIACIFLLLT